MSDATELLMFFRFAHMSDATELLMFFRVCTHVSATELRKRKAPDFIVVLGHMIAV